MEIHCLLSATKLHHTYSWPMLVGTLFLISLRIGDDVDSGGGSGWWWRCLTGGGGGAVWGGFFVVCCVTLLLASFPHLTFCLPVLLGTLSSAIEDCPWLWRMVAEC